MKRCRFRLKGEYQPASAADFSTSKFLLAALQACGTLRDLQTGRHIHLTNNNTLKDIYVSTTLVDMYTKCGCIDQSQHIFNRMPAHTSVTWNSLILGYAENGQPLQALELFSAMTATGAQPDPRTYVGALKACSELSFQEQSCKLLKVESLRRGMEVHSQAVNSGCGDELYVGCTLISMYSKCGSLLDARGVFDRTSLRSSPLWNALILGYVENGEPELGLELFTCMRRELEVDVLGFVSGLKACTSLSEREDGEEVDGKLVKLHSLFKGMEINSQATELGLEVEAETMLSNTLIDMYATCGCMQLSRYTLDRMSSHTVVSWNALLTGYTLNLDVQLALELFLRMTTPPDARTFVSVVKACSVSGDLDRGRALHRLAGEAGILPDTFLSSSLVDMYVKCGSLVEAQRVYDTYCYSNNTNNNNNNVVAWNSLLLGFAERGPASCALELFRSSDHGCVNPDALTFVAVFKACASLAAEEQLTEVTEDGKVVRLQALETTMDMHAEALRRGDVFQATELQNTLLAAYARCGSVKDARRVFDTMKLHDTVSWNALLLAYADNGEGGTALQLLSAVQGEPDERAFTAAVKACTSLAVKESGTELPDGKVAKVLSLQKGLDLEKSLPRELERDVFLATSLVDMYSKCGSPEDARRVFMNVVNPDVALWNSLISCYAENGEGDKALDVLRSSPDARSYSAGLKACSSAGGLEAGRDIHAKVVRLGLAEDFVLELALVDFYSKCGSLVSAQQVFDMAGRSALSSYNALISGYSCGGYVEEVYGLVRRMAEEGVGPDGVSFCSVLAACSHGGRVEEGRRWFEVMEREYGVCPGIEHYHCLVDMLGRANLVDEACCEVTRMKHERDEVTWTTLLANCSKGGKTGVGV